MYADAKNWKSLSRAEFNIKSLGSTFYSSLIMSGKCLSTVFLNIFYASNPEAVPSFYKYVILFNNSSTSWNSLGSCAIGLNLGKNPCWDMLLNNELSDSAVEKHFYCLLLMNVFLIFWLIVDENKFFAFDEIFIISFNYYRLHL